MSAVLFAAATVAVSVMVSEDAFARERYSGDSTSQAAAVNNECLNPIFDSNNIDNAVGVGNCGGTVTQQDESGQAGATSTHQTANPTIELQRATTTQSPGLGAPPSIPGCTDCFNALNPTQQAALILILTQTTQFAGVETPEDLCIELIVLTESGGAIDDALDEVESALSSSEVGISSDVVTSIMECVTQAIEGIMT